MLNDSFFYSYLTYKSAWYFFPLSTPSKVGISLFLKLSVESYTAVTTEETQTKSESQILRGYVCQKDFFHFMYLQSFKQHQESDMP